MPQDRGLGWEMRAITTIAQERFGGLQDMFRHHGWSWLGAGWLGAANRKIVEEYGSIEQFRVHWTEKSNAERDTQ